MRDINMAEIEKYNSTLKQYKEKSATLQAEINYSKKAIADLCAELSKELGQEVTPENIEKVYEEQLTKIENTLHSGQIILNKITETENNMASAVASGQMQMPGQVSGGAQQTMGASIVQQASMANAQQGSAGLGTSVGVGVGGFPSQSSTGMENFMNEPEQAGQMPEYLQQSFYSGAPANPNTMSVDGVNVGNQNIFRI